MRIYEVTLSGKFVEEGEKGEYSFTEFFTKLPTIQSVVEAFTALGSEGTQFFELNKMKQYIPLIPETPDLNFKDNSGMGRSVFPKLRDDQFQIPESAPETCYLHFTYHDTWDK